MMPANFSQAVAKLNIKYRHYDLLLLPFVLAACSQEATEEEVLESATVAAEPAPSSLEQGLALIERHGIEAHLMYLADDALMGDRRASCRERV